MKPKLTIEQQHRNMVTEPIPRLISRLALPTVLSQLVTVVYNSADTFFVSQINTSASAAVGVVFSLMALIHAIGLGIGIGTNSLVSRRLGAKRNDEAEMLVASGFLAEIIMGLVILIGGLLALRPLMRLLGSSETMLPYSCDYARYILLGAPIMCVSYELSSVLRSEGEASLAMIGLCTGSVLNIALDPLLIFTCGLGISGAAIATVISQTVSMLILLSFFLRGKSIVRLNLLHVSRRFSDYLLIVSTGLPTICRQGLMSVATAMLNVQSGVYGDAAVAAMTITNKVYMICRHIVMGIGQGFQPVAGYNYGAGKKARVKEAFGFALMVGTVICLITGSLVFLYRTQIVGWFRNDPDVISIASRALLYTSYIVPVLAYSTYVNHLYQSLGFRKQATLLAACRQGIMFFPLIFTLPRLFGLDGVLFVQPAADFLTFLVSIPFQIWFFKKQLRADASGCAQPS